MTRGRAPAWDDEDDDVDDADVWDDGDPGDDSDDEQTVSCPYCREEILEDAPRCPACGNFISVEEHAGPGKPAWVIVTALICLGMAIWWAFVSG